MKMRGKRLLALMLSAAMAMTGASQMNLQSVYASNKSAANQWDNDELFAGYVQQVFYGKTASLHKTDYVAGRKLTGLDRKLYDLLKEKMKAVADGELAQTTFRFSAADLGLQNSYTAAELGVANIISNGQISAEAKAALNAKWKYDSRAIVDALLLDCPYEMYWYEKTQGSSAGREITGIITSESNTKLGWQGDQYIFFKFAVSTDYSQGSAAGTYLTDTTKTGAAKSAADNVNTVVSQNSGKNNFDKLTAYKDYICEQVTYDHDAVDNNRPYGDPWQLINAFDEDPDTNIVCEGYSKAFQLLCDKSVFTGDVYSILITGLMGGGTGAGGHMWNIVHMENGTNYLVDVTNCDKGSVGYDDKLFLAGAQLNTTATYGSDEYPYKYTNTATKVVYQYDDDLLQIYSSADLTLSATSYHTHDFSDYATSEDFEYTWTDESEITNDTNLIEVSG